MRSFITRALTSLVISGVSLACASSEPELPSASGAGGAPTTADVGALTPNATGGLGSDDERPCTGEACACPEGQRSCAASLLGGAADQASCVDTRSDVGHCGACGTVCAPGQVCFESVCSDECGGGLAPCRGSCVDLATDPLSCGACGLSCGAGACAAGVCPSGKACAVTTSVVQPVLADFESYTSEAPVDTFGFSFNAPPGSPLSVYAGPYQYDDGTAAQRLTMVPGAGSEFAVGIVSERASAWGGALGFWMGCIDASSFDGISFSVRGQVPGGAATLATLTEGTSAPSADDPTAGGTCLSGCAAPSASFPVAAEFSRVLLPWSAFAPGAANQASVSVTGARLVGLTFSVALEWGESAGAPGTFGPVPSSYELVIDDIQFFKQAEVCAPGQQLCDSRCVDLASDDAHCGACGNSCGGGSVCAGELGCVCPLGLTFCAGACVDVQSDASHCGDCSNFCSIGAGCEGGQCAGGAATTSNRCGRVTRRLGNPLGCEFGWGANPDGTIPEFVDFASRWVGYEPNIATRCDGCTWLQSFGDSPALPVYIAYFTAYRANIEDGLGDCNLDFDANNLCTGGAQWIRDHRAELIATYESYARRSYAALSDRPVLWIVEPDFSQYAEGSQSNPLSMTELGQLAADIMCAIKANMPNAVIALNHSTWMAGAELRDFWNAMPLELIDLLHVTSSADVPGGYFNAGDANNRDDGTFRFMNQLTGRPLIADTSFGVTTMQDSWSTASAATLNARIADGVAGVLVYPTPGDYAARIDTLAPQLESTCD